MIDQGAQRRPGGRSARVRRAVLDAALDALHEHGMEGLAVADVASRAGVHETSIYRRWGTRENLMIEALLEEAEEWGQVPDTGSLRDDLIAYAGRLVTYLTSPVGSAFDRALAASGDDPAATEARNRYWEARFARSSEIVKRAIGRGELPETTDVRLAIEMLVAPIHFKVLLTREAPGPELPERIVDSLLHGLVGRGNSGEGASTA
ncbi:TetR/AcrR family transcriptional regulator [Rhodococcus opacus]|uniref:TetR/AcrR family transcriptional regulator n=1 Tax=Rhodococcus opacus TaxID=37919 RepID=UPI0024766E76|nr:TetR/AcrR family transcriptional regulator [Rhodococcus opacus]MDH6286095.1 AcrR family transcriptional regulator [Rhodococcus opacus]